MNCCEVNNQKMKKNYLSTGATIFRLTICDFPRCLSEVKERILCLSLLKLMGLASAVKRSQFYGPNFRIMVLFMDIPCLSSQISEGTDRRGEKKVCLSDHFLLKQREITVFLVLFLVK